MTASTLTNVLSAVVACLFAVGPFAAGESLPAGDGLLLDLLWLAAAVGAALASAKGVPLGPPVRWNRGDAALLLFLGLALVAALVSACTPPVRPSLTFATHLAGLAASYLLARSLLSTPERRQAAALVLAAQAAALASYGIFQALVELPRLRAEFAGSADPAAMLRSQGIDLAPGTAGWTLFQNRLQSPEPFASFALANSFAGFLAPWLAVLAWLAGRAALDRFGDSTPKRGSGTSDAAVLGATAAVVLVCLVLTRSRTAWLALCVGLAAPAISISFFSYLNSYQRKTKENRSLRWLVLGLIGGTLLLGSAAAWAGGLERSILSEAGKSLGYRLQYWKGAVQVAAENPVLGCGPGKFGDWYTRFKAADASEEVQDPHQMFLDAAASAGLPTLAALVAVVAFGLAAAVRASSQRVLDVAMESASEVGDSRERDAAAKSILAGGAWAGLVGGLIRFAEWSPLSADGFWWCTIATPLFCLLLRKVRIPPQTLAEAAAAGWLTWLVDLQAAGGIFFPGVAGGGWLLYSFLAAGPATQVEPSRAAPTEAPSAHAKSQQLVVLIASACFAAGYFFCYQPVQAARSANGRLQAAPTDPQAWEAVVDADPQDAEIARSAAAADLGSHLARPVDAALRVRFERARDRFLARRGKFDSAFHQAAEWEWARYEARHEASLAVAAADFAREAIAWYPNSARRWAVAARAEAAAGRPTAAAAAASRALELHAATPHLDQKLRPDVVAILARLAGAKP